MHCLPLDILNLVSRSPPLEQPITQCPICFDVTLNTNQKTDSVRIQRYTSVLRYCISYILNNKPDVMDLQLYYAKVGETFLQDKT